MIDLFGGTGGAGKTLAVMRDLLRNHRNYKRLYINIAGFKPDLFRRATGNYDIQIIQFDKRTYAPDLLSLFMKIRDEAEELPEDQRIKTLLVYDEAQFSLRDYSTRDDVAAELSNFISLHRHYGPCDMKWMTQGFGKIHTKFKEDVEHFYEALSFTKRTDPENDIVFDEMDPDNLKNILPGGRARIKFKKTELFKDDYGQEYRYFDFYTSGDAGRANKRKNGWKKYLYIFGVLLIVGISLFVFVISELFNSMPAPVQSTSEQTNLPQSESKNHIRFKNPNIDDPFAKYDVFDYSKIEGQKLYKFYFYDDTYYLGDVVLKYKDFEFFVRDNAFHLLSIQKITEKSSYVFAYVDDRVAKALGLSKDFDNANRNDNKEGSSSQFGSNK